LLLWSRVVEILLVRWRPDDADRGAHHVEAFLLFHVASGAGDGEGDGEPLHWVGEAGRGGDDGVRVGVVDDGAAPLGGVEDPTFAAAGAEEDERVVHER
jgi:hypothetical protein